MKGWPNIRNALRPIASVPTECVVRDGNVAEQISALIEEDKDIGILVLAAAVGSKEGPGPLVSSISSQSGKSSFPLPVTIVPGDLSDDDIKAIC